MWQVQQNLGSGIAGTAEYPLGANLTRHEFGAVEHYKSKPRLIDSAHHSPTGLTKPESTNPQTQRRTGRYWKLEILQTLTVRKPHVL